MNKGRSGPRSKNGGYHCATPESVCSRVSCFYLGCWTCRSRKVKCEESRPVCNNCRERGLECDYAPRLKPQRQRRRHAPSLISSQSSVDIENSPSHAPSSTQLSTCSLSLVSHLGSVREVSLELPHGLSIDDWPIALSPTDCQALRHYADIFVPRMVLKTARWSSYSFVLYLCSQHALLAHLVLAFSVRDMAKDDDDRLKLIAIEHYSKALAMFIDHIGASEPDLWLTFPALWLFIHYEQQYGDDPRALQRHLEGVRDIVASHGEVLPSESDNEHTMMKMGDIERPRQIVDRLALWTIYHDACAATFGLGGSLIQLLNERYPGSIARIREGSRTMIEAAWGQEYPIEEQLWDLQISPLEDLNHNCHLLRYELAKLDAGNEALADGHLLEIGRELKRLEQVRFNSHSRVS